MMKRAAYIIFLLLINLHLLHAQNIAGVWEGIMDVDELLQINIVQKNNEICGYTYDHMLENKNDYCRAGFNGEYDSEKEMWLLTGSSFIESCGSRHHLMLIKLWRAPGDAPDVLRATEMVKTSLGFLSEDSTNILLKKVSSSPDMSPMRFICFPENKRKKKKPADAGSRIPVTVKKDSVVSPTCHKKRFCKFAAFNECEETNGAGQGNNQCGSYQYETV